MKSVCNCVWRACVCGPAEMIDVQREECEAGGSKQWDKHVGGLGAD